MGIKGMNGDNVIEATNLVKKFKDFTANDNISLNIRRGESVAIIGDNGAGKTTLVSQLAGVLASTSGEVKYNFKEEGAQPSEAIGMQFQANAFPVGLKTKHILEFFKKTAGEKISIEKLEKHMKAFQINEIYEKEANGLSGGQKQRLNIVIALLSDPEVLVLDEVSTGLDIGVRYRMLSYIEGLKKEGKTIIIVSHSTDEIEALADRVVLLDKGKIKEDKMMTEITMTGTINDYLKKWFIGGRK